MIEPTQLFLTLSCTTPDGVIHRRYTILDVEVLDASPRQLVHHYKELKDLFRKSVTKDHEKAETVS